MSTAAAPAGGGCALGASREGLPAARPRPPPLCPEPRDRATAGPAGPRPPRPRGALPSPGAQPRSPVTLQFLRVRTRPGAPVDVTVNHHVTVTCHRAQGLSRLLFPFSDRALGPAPHAPPAWPRAVSPVRTALAGPDPARKGLSDPGRGGAAYSAAAASGGAAPWRPRAGHARRVQPRGHPLGAVTGTGGPWSSRTWVFGGPRGKTTQEAETRL